MFRCLALLILSFFVFAGLEPSAVFAGGLNQKHQIARVEVEGSGILTAVAFGQIPQGLSVSIVSFDDDDVSRQLMEDFEKKIREQNHLVAEDAPLQLAFDTEVVTSRIPSERPNFGSVRHSSDEGNRTNVNVWSSTKDSVLGGRKTRRDESTCNVYHINMILRDRRTGKVLWQGDARSELIGDPLHVARSMVEPLISSVGRTVKKEAFGAY